MFKKIALILVFLFFICRPTLAAGVEYSLPYPGILPDSPFYILKVARDNVMVFFLRSSKDKAFYFLFMSDKRLAAGDMLVGQNKVHLGITTVAKAQEYFTKAVDEALKIKDSDLLAKLVVSGAKHEEIINNLRSKTSGDDNVLVEKLRVDGQKQDNRVMEVFVQK